VYLTTKAAFLTKRVSWGCNVGYNMEVVEVITKGIAAV